MKKFNSKIYFFLFVFLLNLSSCSLLQKSKDDAETSTQSATSQEDATPLIPSEPHRHHGEKKRITLVLGGAGLASFATVGLLKRLHEESIDIDLLVTSGWPTLFALARGFMGSIHDVEWFAMRLNESDLIKLSNFDSSQKDAENKSLSKIIERSFKNKELKDSKIPIVISTSNTQGGESEIYDRGEWKTPLLRTMALPGIYGKFPEMITPWTTSVRGLETKEAQNRDGNLIVTVEMYQDYIAFLKTGKKDSTDGSFRKAYVETLSNNLDKETQGSEIQSHIELKNSPFNFSQKRLAILTGYREGARLAKLIRRHN